MTPSVSSKNPTVPTDTTKGLAPTDSGACTAACTSKPETVQAGTVEALAAALQALSPADRARLAALLVGQPAEQAEGKGGPA